MEADPVVNTEIRSGLHRLYNAGAFTSGNGKVGVVYISYQGATYLTKVEAARYLAALDAGSTDRHYKVLREDRTRL